MMDSSFVQVGIPKFDGDFDYWSLLVENLLRSLEYWTVVCEGIKEPKAGAEISAAEEKVLEEMRLKDCKAKNYLFRSIDKMILKTITHKATAKELWDSMRTKFQGSARVRRAQLQALRRDFEMLEMKGGETVNQYFGRVMVFSNAMRSCGEAISDVQIVEKILRTLTEKFNYVVCAIEESKDIDTLSVDALQSSLIVHEQKFSRRVVDGDQALKVGFDDGRGRRTGRETFYDRGKGSVSFQGRGNFHKKGRGRDGRIWNRDTIECFKCHRLGHFRNECPIWFTQQTCCSSKNYDMKENVLLMAYVEEEKDVTADEVKENGEDDDNQSKMFFMENHLLESTYEVEVNISDGHHHVMMDFLEDCELESNESFRCTVNQRNDSISEVVGNTTNQKVQEKDSTAEVTTPAAWIGVGEINSLTDVVTSEVQCLTADDQVEKLNLWHKESLYVRHDGPTTMQREDLVGAATTCSTFRFGKQHRRIFPRRSQRIIDQKSRLVHTNRCGLVASSSNSEQRFLKFQQFKASIEKEFTEYTAYLRTGKRGRLVLNEHRSCNSSKKVLVSKDVLVNEANGFTWDLEALPELIMLVWNGCDEELGVLENDREAITLAAYTDYWAYNNLAKEVYMMQPQGFLVAGEEDQQTKFKIALYELLQVSRTKKCFIVAGLVHTVLYRNRLLEAVMRSQLFEEFIQSGHVVIMCRLMRYFQGVLVVHIAEGLVGFAARLVSLAAVFSAEIAGLLQVWAIKKWLTAAGFIKYLITCGLVKCSVDFAFTAAGDRVQVDTWYEKLFGSLWYLNGTLGYVIIYKREGLVMRFEGCNIKHYTDVMDKRRSMNCQESRGVVYGDYKKQHVEILFIIESEYVAATDYTIQYMWARWILKLMGWSMCVLMVGLKPLVDDSSSIKLSRSLCLCGRSKLNGRFSFQMDSLKEQGVILKLFGVSNWMAMKVGVLERLSSGVCEFFMCSKEIALEFLLEVL
ncbi:unnamed protein product [Linum trigynum]|uniref:CCHC-type domain-containing protein n=1 Tax=Linum trigynum TaxID=586398 RepID=A0AAV2EPT2_9ROSI